MSKNTRNRILLTALAALLLVVVAVGGTVAWLTASTETIKNTFTTAGVDITLTETFNTDTDNDNVKDAWSAQLIPGQTYTKNPVVTVLDTTDVDIYLFVKFEETNTPSTYLTYTSTLTAANGWTQGNDTEIPDNVWYREVKAADTTKSWKLLDGDKVTVKSELTNDTMASANATPELKYTAYAIQKDNVGTVAEAWAKIGK